MDLSDSFVIPGQYIVPEFDVDDSGILRHYIPGRGCSISMIEDANTKKAIPVLVATLLGKKVISKVTDTIENEAPDKKQDNVESKIPKKYLVKVVNRNGKHSENTANMKEAAGSDPQVSINLPQEKDIVLARIIRLNSKQAFCEILTVEGYGNIVKDSGLGANGEYAHASLPPGAGSQNLSSYEAIASHCASLNSASSDLGESFRGIIRVQDIRQTDKDKVKIVDCFRPGDIVRAEIISIGDGSNYYLATARNDLGVIFAKSEGGAGGIMYALDWQTMICPESGIIENRKCAKPFI